MPLNRRTFVAASLLAPGLAQAQAQSAPKAVETAFAEQILEAREASLRLAPEPLEPTDVWAFDGRIPGPLIRVKMGEEVRIRLQNGLRQPMALHWQGVNLANAMDGTAGLTQPPVEPGAGFEYRFTPPNAGFFWYRASAWPFAAEQKGRGLYGLLIVDEAAPPAVDHEAILVLDDWRLNEKGALADFLAAADAAGEGRIGDLVTVNGVAAPQTMSYAPGARLRLRILNACNARLAGLIFEGAAPLVLAIDGQPCDPFAPSRNIIPASPGARFDMLLDMPAKADAEVRVMLRGGGLKADAGGEPDRPLMVLKAQGEPLPARPAPVGLPANPRLPPEIRLQNAKRMDLRIEASQSKDPRQTWLINGEAGSPKSKPLFSVAKGQPVSLGFLNQTKVAQTLHLHGHHMRVLHLKDDGWEPYWRDCVIAAPGQTVRVAFIADNPGKWVIESTILEHAMSGVFAWFEVK